MEWNNGQTPGWDEGFGRKYAEKIAGGEGGQTVGLPERP
jgi:hypothetical protein